MIGVFRKLIQNFDGFIMGVAMIPGATESIMMMRSFQFGINKNVKTVGYFDSR